MILECDRLFEYITSTPPQAFVDSPLTLTYAFKRQKRGFDIPLTIWSNPLRAGIDTVKLSRMMHDENPHYDHLPRSIISK